MLVGLVAGRVRVRLVGRLGDRGPCLGSRKAWFGVVGSNLGVVRVRAEG